MESAFKQSYKSPPSEMTALSVYNVGHQKCTPRYQWGPGVRNHYLIHYVVSGRGVYETRGRRYALRAGDAFLALPDTEITYYADESDPWEYVWVGFAGNDALPILQCTDFTPDSPVVHPRNGPEFRAAVQRVYEMRGAEFLHAVRMTGALYGALALLMRRENPERVGSAAEQYVRKAETYIAHHYALPLTVTDVAAYVGIDRTHLYAVFKQTTGLSPKEYLTDYRLRRACALLLEPALSVTAVANSVGFENSLYFSKVFRKHMGLSPSEYRARRSAESQRTREGR